MINILIVEDEAPISNLIRLSLAKEGYHCTCAFDGLEAADYLEKNQYDLIVLDVMLPEIDGFELMDYIRPLEISVIFLTAKSSVQDRVKGLKLGAEDYIVKPFEVIELLARIDVVLRRYKKGDMMLEREEAAAFGDYRMVWGTLQIVNGLETYLNREVLSRTMEQLYQQNSAFWSNLRLSTTEEVIYEGGTIGKRCKTDGTPY